MKVLALSHSSAWDYLGGAELSLLHLLADWTSSDSDVEPIVVTRAPEGILQKELHRLGIETVTMDFDAWVLPQRIESEEDQFRLQLINDAATNAIANLIRSKSIDIVLTNTMVSPWAAIAAGLEGVPHIWMVREYGDLDHALQFQNGRAETLSDIGWLSDVVIANSEALRKHLEQWIDPAKLEVVYPPVDRAHVETMAVASRHPRERSTRTRIVMAGRVSESKGQARLIDAIGRLRERGVDCEAVFVGSAEGEYARSLESRVAAGGLQDVVTFVGYLENPYPEIAQSDIVLSAGEREAFGRTVLEGMLLGKAVVVANSGGGQELIVDGKTGVLYDPSDRSDLDRAIEGLATSPEVRKLIAKNAQEAAYSFVASGAPSNRIRDLMSNVIETSDRVRQRPKLPNFFRTLLGVSKVASEVSRRESERSSAQWVAETEAQHKHAEAERLARDSAHQRALIGQREQLAEEFERKLHDERARYQARLSEYSEDFARQRRAMLAEKGNAISE